MCYKCTNIQLIIALAAAASSLDNIVGGEDAQRAICNVINEMGNGLANDMADERHEAEQESALAAGNKLHEEAEASMKVGPETPAAAGPKVRDEVGAGPAKQEAGAGEVTDQRTKEFMGLVMLLTALSNRDKKEDKAQ